MWPNCRTAVRSGERWWLTRVQRPQHLDPGQGEEAADHQRQSAIQRQPAGATQAMQPQHHDRQQHDQRGVDVVGIEVKFQFGEHQQMKGDAEDPQPDNRERQGRGRVAVATGKFEPAGKPQLRPAVEIGNRNRQGEHRGFLVPQRRNQQCRAPDRQRDPEVIAGLARGDQRFFTRTGPSCRGAEVERGDVGHHARDDESLPGNGGQTRISDIVETDQHQHQARQHQACPVEERRHPIASPQLAQRGQLQQRGDQPQRDQVDLRESPRPERVSREKPNAVNVAHGHRRGRQPGQRLAAA